MIEMLVWNGADERKEIHGNLNDHDGESFTVASGVQWRRRLWVLQGVSTGARKGAISVLFFSVLCLHVISALDAH